MSAHTIGRFQATDIVNLRKAALAAVGHSASSVARELGVARQTVGMVITGKATSARIEEKIAEVTGYPRSELFPSQTAAA